METYVQLLQLYNEYGIDIKTGLYPWHFPLADEMEFVHSKTRIPFTGMFINDQIMGAGGGLHPLEIMLLSSVSKYQKPQKILVIGNSFGWSTFALALANPDATILAIDNLSEGSNAQFAFGISQKIASENFPNVNIIEGTSPDDIDTLVHQYLEGVIDLALIDGLHTNEQQTKDFQALEGFLSTRSLVLFHDVLNINMTKSFVGLQKKYRQYESAILPRMPSGMGYFLSKESPAQTLQLLSSFTENPKVIKFLYNEIKSTRIRNKFLGGEMKIPIEQDGHSKSETIQINKPNPWIDRLIHNCTSHSWAAFFTNIENMEIQNTKVLNPFIQNHPHYIGSCIYPNGMINQIILFLGMEKGNAQKLAKKLKQTGFIFGEYQKESTHIGYI